MRLHFMTQIERNEKRWNQLKASDSKIESRKQCLVCHRWIHKEMEYCQPCEFAKPQYSNLHKFSK